VDADRDEAELAVGIRTFWAERNVSGRRVLRFGTGAGITWGSDPAAEWAETELKAARLVSLASSSFDNGSLGAASAAVSAIAT
jgi:para-aminobenzoate synthetase component 1